MQVNIEELEKQVESISKKIREYLMSAMEEIMVEPPTDLKNYDEFKKLPDDLDNIMDMLISNYREIMQLVYNFKQTEQQNQDIINIIGDEEQ